ncbi:MAG: shikimate kinase [Bacteroidetes bacterium]|jgi:shikimate kinase|nr:shikimate kinase [Bacteroidota bacterium]
MKVILGYMGCGKTSVGSYLSEHHNLSFGDLDDFIERRENRSIKDIFQHQGEIYFRRIEHQCLKDCLEQQPYDIFALGGGTPCYANNMELINAEQNVTSIYLKVDLETLTHRLFNQKQQRPLIQNIHDKRQLKDFIRKHLFEREHYYRQAKHLIDVSEMRIEAIGQQILSI